MDADTKSILFASTSLVANIFGTVAVRYAGAFGLAFYLPAYAVGIVCGLLGLGYSLFVKSNGLRIYLWACIVASASMLFIASRLPIV